MVTIPTSAAFITGDRAMPCFYQLVVPISSLHRAVLVMKRQFKVLGIWLFSTWHGVRASFRHIHLLLCPISYPEVLDVGIRLLSSSDSESGPRYRYGYQFVTDKDFNLFVL